PLRTPGRSQRRHQIGALSATPGCARRRATGGARLAGPAPARDRARGELLPALSGPFDAAAPRGDDDRSSPQAADRGCVVRNGFLLNTADTTCGDPDTNAAQPGGDAAIVRRARRASERTPFQPAQRRQTGAIPKTLRSFLPGQAHARHSPGPLHTMTSP